MIVKNLMAVGVIAGFAGVASAADANWKVSGKLRMDAVQSTTETKDGEADKKTTKSSSIFLKRAQFNLVGDAGGDTLTFNYYADKNELNVAKISHKFSDMVTVDFGKMYVLAQSWENSYRSTDEYSRSWVGKMSPDNSTGAQVNANFGDHNVSLQLVEGVHTTVVTDDLTGDTTSTTFNSGGSLTAALQYRGEINKMIRPLVTYTSVKTSGTKGCPTGTSDCAATAATNRGNGYQTQMGLGVQVDTAGVVADVEYDTVKAHKLKLDVDTTTNKDSDYTAMILQVKYAIGVTTPFLKVASNSAKHGQENGVSDKTGMDMALGVEHKLDDHCRLHAVYVSEASSMKTSATLNKKVTMTAFNLGVTAAM